jgi:hypothetical protein
MSNPAPIVCLGETLVDPTALLETLEPTAEAAA